MNFLGLSQLAEFSQTLGDVKLDYIVYRKEFETKSFVDLLKVFGAEFWFSSMLCLRDFNNNFYEIN